MLRQVRLYLLDDLGVVAGLFGLSALLAFLVDAPEANALAGDALTRNVWTAGIFGLAVALLTILVVVATVWWKILGLV